MKRDEYDLADALERHWDAVQRGEAMVTAEIDSDLTKLVGQLHAAGAAMPALFPDPEMAWRELRQESTPSSGAWSHGETASDWPHPNGHAEPVFGARRAAVQPRRWGRWVLAQMATAALLLLMLAVGFIATRQRLPNAPDEGTWVPALVNAIESNSSGIIDTPLFETTFTAEELPAGEKEAIYYQLTIPPGTSLPFLAAPYCRCFGETITKGVGAEIVRSGTYSLRLDVPVRVQRAGSAQPTEAIPPGQEVALAPGDVVIYPNYAAVGEIHNAGTEPVSLIGVAIIGMGGTGTPLPVVPPTVQTTLLTNAFPSLWATFPPGPVHVALYDLTLLPGTRIGPYQPIGFEALHVASGTIERSFLPAGQTAPQGRPIPLMTGETSPFMTPRLDVRTIIASTGDKPANLLALLIEPDATSAQSLAP